MSAEKIQKWLEMAGATRIRESGDNLVSTCPFHSAGKSTEPNFAINAQTGLFICYSANCGVSGNIVRFLTECLGWSSSKALEEGKEISSIFYEENDEESIIEMIGLPAYEDRRKKEEKGRGTKDEAILGAYRFCPRYMTGRGFDPRVLLALEIGYDTETDRVTIPVRDEEGRLVGFSKRAVVPDVRDKFLHLHFNKSEVLYGAYLLKNGYFLNPDEVWVTEGQFDTLALAQVYERQVASVSTMGSRVSKVQVGMISKFSKVVLAFDNPATDEDGLRTTIRVGDALLEKGHRDVWVADQFPDGVKDPGDLIKRTRKELSAYRKNITPYDSWRLDRV